MELSSTEMNVELLVFTVEAQEAVVNAKLLTQRAAEMTAGEKLRPCRVGHCGQCPRCLDNARWERIFKEKFEDPTYYAEHLVKYASPLS